VEGEAVNRARVFLIAVATALIAVSPYAQTRTADGVDAFLRGDYGGAAAILKPLAETPWAPDHTAAFFMAVLYDRGLGVSPDPLRACAMLIRATAVHDSPLGMAAMGLIRERQRTLGREAFDTCNWRASNGFDDRFEPITFALDQEHWIAWDRKGATISYRGADTRVELPLVQRHVKLLTIRHTELAGGSDRSNRRHFVEFVRWTPLAQARTWTLTWTLFEVVRDQLISVSTQQLTTAAGEEPPLESTVDLAALVSLRINGNGDPEYAVLTGDARQRGVVASDAERQELKAFDAQQARARQSPPDRDPSRVFDVHRRAAVTYAAADADGCGHVFVYGWTHDRAEAIAVRADKEPLRIATAGTFDLAAPPAGLDVRLHVYERAMSRFPFCTDIGVPGLVEEVWRPTRGTITVQLSAAEPSVRAPGHYRATVQISGAQFVSPSGVRVDQTQPITLSAIVGWLAG
jgi:hypothetical protein